MKKRRGGKKVYRIRGEGQRKRKKIENKLGKKEENI